MGKFEKKATKKPITKKWWFWTLVVFVAVGIIGNLAGLGEDPQQSAAKDPSTSQTSAPVVTDPVQTEPSKETEAASALPFDVTFSDTFRNDSTGRWRKALIASTETPDKYAVDYYKEYFKSDDEVHIVYNFTLNTVNAITVQSGTLFVNITEYQKDEEHDAKEACSGEYYGQYQFDLTTGALTYSTFE